MRGGATKTILSAAILALVTGCRSGSNVAPPAVNAPAGDAKAPAPANGSAGVPQLRVVLDDPRLAAARAFERARDWAAAAKAVKDARPAELPVADACAWSYVEGRLWLAAGAPSEALANASAAFEAASDPACPLSGYARLRAAQSLARAGHADEAIARARTVPEDLPVQDDTKLVLAEALGAKGDRAAALPLWRAWLAANPHGSRWVDTSVRVALALLDGVDGPPDAHAREAYELATKVVVEAPKLADSSGATAARARAVAASKGKAPAIAEALSDAERARQAQAWLDAGDAQKAFELASSVLGPKKPSSTKIACTAALTRANAAQKAKAKGDAWADAAAACEKEPELVTVLYAGAKARTKKEPKAAIEWYGKVEELFSSHRLADDARFKAALLLAQSGEAGSSERAEEMLRTLPEAYPSGDMRTEALFRVALARMQRGEWESAKPLLDRIVEITPEDRHWATAGRAEYFRARADAATGDREGAGKRLRHVVERHPLTFYMLMAYGRLAAEDAAKAKATLDEAIARDKAGVFPAQPHAELASPGFARATRLLEVGEIDAARRELAACGATSDGVDPEVLWTVGALYNQAGAPELGHAFSRSRLTDFLEHYPEGRWRVPWEVAYPRAFEALVVKACEKYALPRPLAWAIMREESSFVPEAKSPSNAFGLMQLIAPTAKWMASGTALSTDEASLKKPEVSIELGTKLLAQLRSRHGHPALAIGAYNGGSGAVGRWLEGRATDDLDLFVELVPWDETRNYIKRVLSSNAAYAYLYDRPGLSEPLGLPLRLAAR